MTTMRDLIARADSWSEAAAAARTSAASLTGAAATVIAVRRGRKSAGPLLLSLSMHESLAPELNPGGGWTARYNREDRLLLLEPGGHLKLRKRGRYPRLFVDLLPLPGVTAETPRLVVERVERVDWRGKACIAMILPLGLFPGKR